MSRVRYRIKEVNGKKFLWWSLIVSAGVIIVMALTPEPKKEYPEYIPNPPVPPKPHEDEIKVKHTFYINDGTNMRLTPSLNGKYVGKLENVADFSNITIINTTYADGNFWLLVKGDNNRIGYISGDYCHYLEEKSQHLHNLTDASGFIKANYDNVNMRLDPWKEENNNYIEKIKKDEYAKVIGVIDRENLEGIWYLVAYGNHIGFVDSQYVSYYPNLQIDDIRNTIKTVVVDGDGVRLRTAPNTDSNVFTSLNKGTELKYVSENAEWYLVEYSTKYGNQEFYISKQHSTLKEENVIPEYLQNVIMTEPEDTKTI